MLEILGKRPSISFEIPPAKKSKKWSCPVSVSETIYRMGKLNLNQNLIAHFLVIYEKNSSSNFIQLKKDVHYFGEFNSANMPHGFGIEFSLENSTAYVGGYKNSLREGKGSILKDSYRLTVEVNYCEGNLLEIDLKNCVWKQLPSDDKASKLSKYFIHIAENISILARGNIYEENQSSILKIFNVIRQNANGDISILNEHALQHTSQLTFPNPCTFIERILHVLSQQALALLQMKPYFFNATIQLSELKNTQGDQLIGRYDGTALLPGYANIQFSDGTEWDGLYLESNSLRGRVTLANGFIFEGAFKFYPHRQTFFGTIANKNLGKEEHLVAGTSICSLHRYGNMLIEDHYIDSIPLTPV